MLVKKTRDGNKYLTRSNIKMKERLMTVGLRRIHTVYMYNDKLLFKKKNCPIDSSSRFQNTT